MHGFLNFRRQVTRQDGRAVHMHHRIFQRIDQLPDIARPAISAKRIKRLVGKLDVAPRMAGKHIGKHGTDQQRNIFLAFAQRGNMQRKHPQPVIKIRTELATTHHGRQVPVRRRDNPHVHLARLIFAEPFDFMFLQDAQQLYLNTQGNLANFVQQQRPAVRRLEAAFACYGRAGECAARMTEQFIFEQMFGKCGAVYPHVGFFGAARVFMQRARNQLLAAAALAGKEDAGLAGRRPQDLTEQFLHDTAVPDQPAQAQPVSGGFFQLHLMGAIAQHHGAIGQLFLRGQHHGPHAQGDQCAIRALHDKVLNFFPLDCALHERAMPSLFAAPRASRALKKTGAEFIQNIIVVLPQHAAGRFIDCHNVTLLVKKKNPLFQIVEKLPQSSQTDHDYPPPH